MELSNFNKTDPCNLGVQCELLESTRVLYNPNENYPPIVHKRSGYECMFLGYSEKELVCLKDGKKKKTHQPKPLNLKKKGKNLGCCHFHYGPPTSSEQQR